MYARSETNVDDCIWGGPVERPSAQAWSVCLPVFVWLEREGAFFPKILRTYEQLSLNYLAKKIWALDWFYSKLAAFDLLLVFGGFFSKLATFDLLVWRD